MSITKNRYDEVLNRIKSNNKITLVQIRTLEGIFRDDIKSKRNDIFGEEEILRDKFNKFLKANKIVFYSGSYSTISNRVLKVKNNHYVKYMLLTIKEIVLLEIVNSNFFGYYYQPKVKIISSDRSEEPYIVIAKINYERVNN